MIGESVDEYLMVSLIGNMLQDHQTMQRNPSLCRQLHVASI